MARATPQPFTVTAFQGRAFLEKSGERVAAGVLGRFYAQSDDFRTPSSHIVAAENGKPTGSAERGYWVLQGDVAVRDDVLVITRLELRPELLDSLPGDEVIASGVSASAAGDMVRAIRFGELLRSVHALVQQRAKWLADYARSGYTISPYSPYAKSVRDAAQGVARAKLQRGRRGYDPGFYRWVAMRYLELQANNTGRGIRQVIGQEGRKRLDRREPVPPDTVKTWLTKAKSKGFIVFEKQGRVGAYAGPELYPTPERRGTKRGKRQ